MKKHSARRGLDAWCWWFDDVHRFSFLCVGWIFVRSGAERVRWAELGLEKPG